MNLDEALAVWAYANHQYEPSKEVRDAAYKAWQVICQEANKVIYPAAAVPAAPVVSNGDR